MKRMDRYTIKLLLSLQSALLASTLLISPAAALDNCTSTAGSKKPREVVSGAALMIAAAQIEAQGESNFKPNYENQGTPCLIETFDAVGRKISATYVKFEKGPQTMLYRFASEKEGHEHNILVLYNGSAAAMLGASRFYVTETYGADNAYYAMYSEEPSYAAVKALALKILDQSAEPLMAATWPTGAKEPVIKKFSKRLK